MASSPAAPPVADAPAAPFDTAAAGYDAAFTDRLLGRWLRGITCQRLGRAFGPGDHVLELGCGPGQDAVWLALRGVRVTATDASQAMLDVTRRKADAAGVGEMVRVARVDMGELDSRRGVWHTPASGHRTADPGAPPATPGVCHTPLLESPPLDCLYDGAVSNFGPLNCVADRLAVVETLARVVRPGGRVVLGVMGPLCPWEFAWQLAHGHPRAATRRLRAGVEARVGDGGRVRVWYPSARRLRREFAPHFRTLELAGVGLLLPPSEMGGLVERAPRLFGRLAAADRRFAARLPWRWLNDHYLLTLERR